MKIFSNFDTKLRQKKLKEYQDLYGQDKALILQKSRFFLVIKTLPKILSFLIVIILVFFVSKWIFLQLDVDYTIYIVIWTLVVLLSFSWPVIKHLIDYYMDFAIITPKALVMFNQTWLFKRDMATVDVDKIKTILVKKRWILFSIFNNWDLIFLSEWDSERYGEIKLYFIYQPEKKKEKVSKIIWYEL